MKTRNKCPPPFLLNNKITHGVTPKQQNIHQPACYFSENKRSYRLYAHSSAKNCSRNEESESEFDYITHITILEWRHS